MYKASFNYELKIPVMIASAGQEVKAISIEVFAPTNQVMNEVGIIDFEFNKAGKNAIKESSDVLKDISPEVVEKIQKREKKEGEISGRQIVKEMTMYGADINRCFFALKNILTAGNKEQPVCKIDNEKMTAPIFDSLGFDDTKSILGEYIINFLDISQDT